MTYQVLVRGNARRGYTARVLSLPSVEVSAPTEAQAIAGARAAIAEVVRDARLVEVEVAAHGWAPLAGLYEGDQQFAAVLEEIQAYRGALSSQEALAMQADRTELSGDDAP
ncbi:MAG: hypothetical protein FJX74_09445 [Armatimonadetes bacterium]|nr:hypothetical protein [Armatimonadota bacterium]